MYLIYSYFSNKNISSPYWKNILYEVLFFTEPAVFSTAI